eukprot:1259240-Prymnesium_polylepis.1
MPHIALAPPIIWQVRIDAETLDAVRGLARRSGLKQPNIAQAAAALIHCGCDDLVGACNWIRVQ